MKKIVVLQNIPQFKDEIQKIVPDWDIVFTSNKDEALRELKDAEIILGWSNSAGKAIVDENTSVKWVQAYSAGMDSMPLEALEKKGILVTTSSGIHPRPISESVFALMLMFARQIPMSMKYQEKAQWATEHFGDHNMGEIHGKTIGILGTGALGEEIARIARAFSMRTLGLRRTKQEAPYIDEMYTMDELYTMLGKCDYVVNVLPHTKETTGIINADAFNAMRDGAYYLNFGRGGSTVTKDLIEALKSGKLAGAGLDVVDPEPLPSDSPLWAMENVLITHHTSGRTAHYNERLVDIFTENLKSYLETGTPSINLVDTKKQY